MGKEVLALVLFVGDTGLACIRTCTVVWRADVDSCEGRAFSLFRFVSGGGDDSSLESLSSTALDCVLEGLPVYCLSLVVVEAPTSTGAMKRGGVVVLGESGPDLFGESISSSSLSSSSFSASTLVVLVPACSDTWAFSFNDPLCSPLAGNFR